MFVIVLAEYVVRRTIPLQTVKYTPLVHHHPDGTLAYDQPSRFLLTAMGAIYRAILGTDRLAALGHHLGASNRVVKSLHSATGPTEPRRLGDTIPTLARIKSDPSGSDRSQDGQCSVRFLGHSEEDHVGDGPFL